MRALVVIVVLGIGSHPVRAQDVSSYLGALSPEGGDFVLSAGGGLLLRLPQATASARIGLGGGTRLELTYDNIAVLGQAAEAVLAWGFSVREDLALGLLAKTGIGTLELVGDIGGIDFTNFEFGNDWTASSALQLSWLRARGADVTAALGVDFTLAQRRFTSFEESDIAIDFALRGVGFAIQGEWVLEAGRHLFIRLEGVVPLHTEITPIGFLPTASAGVAWYL